MTPKRVCATDLWAIDEAAFTPEFDLFTAEGLGAAPTRPLRISSDRVRDSSVVFALTDCDTLVGRRDDSPVGGEVSADALLGWLRDPPSQVPHVSRVGVLRTWSSEDDVAVPSRACGTRIHEVSEGILCGFRDDNLLTIDCPHRMSGNDPSNDSPRACLTKVDGCG